MSLRKKVHIIGGGISGYTAAIAFSHHNFDTFIWEKQETPFFFSSSRNSAMARSYEADPYLSYLLKYSLFLMSGAHFQDQPLFTPVGLLIQPMEYDYEEETFFNDYPNEPFAKSLKSREHTIVLPNGDHFSGMLIPGNGILHLDVLQAYFRQKAANTQQNFYKSLKTIRLKDTQIEELILDLPDSSTYRLSLGQGDILVNAAGSWAKEIMEQNNIHSPELTAYKRHMFLLENPKNFLVNLPILWNEVRDFYVKYHGGDLLVSYCDESVSLPSNYNVDPHQAEKFREKLNHQFAFLKDYKIKKIWSCLRTFTPDDRPIVGFDPSVKNLFWSAGWGGRGMSMAVGMIDRMKKLIQKGYPSCGEESEYDNPFSVFRFGMAARTSRPYHPPTSK